MTDDITNVGLSETSILETPWGNLKGPPESLMFFFVAARSMAQNFLSDLCSG